jgi:hypothetical protein
VGRDRDSQLHARLNYANTSPTKIRLARTDIIEFGKDDRNGAICICVINISIDKINSKRNSTRDDESGFKLSRSNIGSGFRRGHAQFMGEQVNLTPQSSPATPQSLVSAPFFGPRPLAGQLARWSNPSIRRLVFPVPHRFVKDSFPRRGRRPSA